MNEPILKYPRTPHLAGSRLQPGDEDLAAVRLDEVRGLDLVVEEKVDGANAGLRFTAKGELRLQSRGHYLVGGGRERHFDLFKTWATAHRSALWELLGDRYVVYGEWLHAKHTVFYDQLPHYFLEFDVLDTTSGAFLSTEARRRLLADSPLRSVPVLWRGRDPQRSELDALITTSRFKSAGWEAALELSAREAGVDAARAARETDPSPRSEGLYVKAERGDQVVGRYKFIRRSFLTSVLDSGSHWLERPIVPNRLASGVDLFAPGAAR